MRLFFIIIFFLVSLSAPSIAKDADLYPYAYTSQPKYERMAREALARKPAYFDFMTFRSLYANTRQYDPISEETIEKMHKLAFAAVNGKNPEDRDRALSGYQFLIADHLANVGVISQALAYARQDKRFGNVNFFRWMQSGLMQSVMNSREGRTLKDAYAIVTFPEETVLLSQIGVRLIQINPRKEGFTYYNMNDVEDLRTGQRWTVFVNTNFPMGFLERKQKFEQKNKTIQIPRQ